jgi:hypothetical protein
MVLWLANSW